MKTAKEQCTEAREQTCKAWDRRMAAHKDKETYTNTNTNTE